MYDPWAEKNLDKYLDSVAKVLYPKLTKGRRAFLKRQIDRFVNKQGRIIYGVDYISRPYTEGEFLMVRVFPVKNARVKVAFSLG